MQGNQSNHPGEGTVQSFSKACRDREPTTSTDGLLHCWRDLTIREFFFSVKGRFCARCSSLQQSDEPPLGSAGDPEAKRVVDWLPSFAGSPGPCERRGLPGGWLPRRSQNTTNGLPPSQHPHPWHQRWGFAGMSLPEKCWSWARVWRKRSLPGRTCRREHLALPKAGQRCPASFSSASLRTSSLLLAGPAVPRPEARPSSGPWLLPESRKSSYMSVHLGLVGLPSPSPLLPFPWSCCSQRLAISALPPQIQERGNTSASSHRQPQPPSPHTSKVGCWGQKSGSVACPAN